MSDPTTLAITAMVSLPQWEDFERAFVEKREAWLRDTRDPRVYNSHSELVSTMSRVAEIDDWLEIFRDAKSKVTSVA